MAVGVVDVVDPLSSVPSIALCLIGGQMAECLGFSDERPPPSQNKSPSDWFVSELVASFLTVFTPSSGQRSLLTSSSLVRAVTYPLSPAAVWSPFLFSGQYRVLSFSPLCHTGPLSSTPPPASLGLAASSSCFPLSAPSPFPPFFP